MAENPLSGIDEVATLRAEVGALAEKLERERQYALHLGLELAGLQLQLRSTPPPTGRYVPGLLLPS